MDLQELAASVECVSRRYASAFGIERTSDWQILKLQEEVGELTQVHLMRQGQARPKGNTPAELDEKLADEIADVLCHALLLAEHHQVDLPAAIRRKWLSRVEPADTTNRDARPRQAPVVPGRTGGHDAVWAHQNGMIPQQPA